MNKLEALNELATRVKEWPGQNTPIVIPPSGWRWFGNTDKIALVRRSSPTDMDNFKQVLPGNMITKDEWLAFPASPTVDPLYTMKLHEIIEIDGATSVTRVPNGWIYDTVLIANNQPMAMTSTFVKYSTEFKHNE